MAKDTGTSHREPNDNITIIAILLSVFFVFILGTAYLAWKRSRHEPAADAVWGRLVLLRSMRGGLGAEAVDKIPTFRYRAPSSALETSTRDHRFGNRDRSLAKFWSIPAVRYVHHIIHVTRQGSTNAPASSCSICTEDFEDGDQLRRLPCTHVFHPACIDPWLRDRARTCPLCRVDLEAQLPSRTPIRRPPKIKTLPLRRFSTIRRN